MSDPLSIIHCMRAPLGGLFRHVCDLAKLQSQAGHKVGIVCDAEPANENIERTLRHFAEVVCVLGVSRIPMSRQVGWHDFTAARAVYKLAENSGCDILHGHGAKGGAYARLASAKLKRRGKNNRAFYTPHGGSLHYDPRSLQGRIFMGAERRLGPKTDGLIFESSYSSGLYHQNVGPFPCERRVIHNGLRPDEFYQLVLDVDACEFVFVGELRQLKGVDIFLQALSRIAKERPIKAFLAGSGPDEKSFKNLARKLGIAELVTFAGPTPARTAFARGQCLVVPSRAESLPYIVLECAAAGLPFIATDVGGISEIVDGSDVELIPPENTDALEAQMRDFLERPSDYSKSADGLKEIVAQRFNVNNMVQKVTEFYVDRLADASDS